MDGTTIVNREAREMTLGAEAASIAAVDAGVKGVFAYPGTPSTEVYEGAERIINGLNDGRVAKIGANEKIAYEFALGASYAGHRSMVTMKHVGLNVAMDAFVNSGITGVNGGMVVVVADDPSMHSSQNEQDSRYLADFAHIPCLEPSTPQEVYDYTREAFLISEELKLPVMVRLVTRLAHSRGPIFRSPSESIVELGTPSGDEKRNWVLIPSNARVQYKKLREKLPTILKRVSKYNPCIIGSSESSKVKTAVVTSGMGRAYFDQIKNEVVELNNYTRLDVSAYPLSKQDLRTISQYDDVYVFEENYPYLEDQLIDMAGVNNKIHGRRDGTLGEFEGELNQKRLRIALGLDLPNPYDEASIEVPPRPPKFCDGCGHGDAFTSLTTALKNIGVDDYRIFGDIGCYTLGALPPYNAIHTCVEMGASAGMSLGAALTGMSPAVGVIGDSTFFHSAVPTLVTMAQSKKNITFIIMDNRITGMTGQQETVAHDIIEKIAIACGFPESNIHTLTPLPKRHEENTKMMESILSHDGPDIVIFKRDCIQALRKGIYKKLGIK